MTWLGWYRLRTFVRNSIWIMPLASMVAALIAFRVIHWIDQVVGWESNLGPDAARAVLGALTSSMLTFIVFVFSTLLVAVQIASAQLTPRIIATTFRDPVTKFALTVFVFTFTFSLAVLARIDKAVPWLSGWLAAYGCLGSLVVFLFMIDHVGKSLRPVRVVTTVATQGRKVIDLVYPRRLTMPGPGTEITAWPVGKPTRTVSHTGDGVLLAFDEKGLVSLARQTNCVIELVPHVGDFVAKGDPLFHLHEGAGLAEKQLRHSVAFGPERTMEQDPAFIFRIIVDIASKALSPAINDPTTAVLALDQIHHLLRQVGVRDLNTGQVNDEEGKPRLFYRTPDWEDFVGLAVTEIRHFGRDSIQVVRRLRAMLENLIKVLPEPRAARLHEELDLLHRCVERGFEDPEDRKRADTADTLGMGGSF